LQLLTKFSARLAVGAIDGVHAGGWTTDCKTNVHQPQLVRQVGALSLLIQSTFAELMQIQSVFSIKGKLS
jgi:hypothetical protein